MGREIASERGNTPITISAKPSFGNIAVWKIVYDTEKHFYVDAVKTGITSNKKWYGSNIRKFDAVWILNSCSKYSLLVLLSEKLK